MTTNTMGRDEAGKAIRKRAMEGCPLARELLILRGMCSCQGDEKSVDDAEGRYLELAALQAECEKLRKDAERYRYIKKGNQWIVAATQTGAQIDGEDLDDLIDSEMEQQT